MDFTRISKEARLERLQARSARARKWARTGTLGLIGLCLTAIWQDRALAPQMHDKMQAGYEIAWEFIEGEETRGYLTAMSGFSGNGNKSEYNAITTWLLNNRN